MPTKIEWTEETWNPVTGCTKVSAGCQNCYAERMAKRLAGRYGYPADDPFRVTLQEDQLSKPLSWRKPRMVFVCSMGDLFHPDVPDEYITQIFDVMAKARWYRQTFQVLTKRPERMREHLLARKALTAPNVWLGVTAENQETADQRIPILLQTPAAVRFVSCEPLLGSLDLAEGGHGWLFVTDLTDGRRTHLDWVIVGGESGPKARPAHPDWFRSIRDQCQSAGVPFFFKQWGEWIPVDEVPSGYAHYNDVKTPGKGGHVRRSRLVDDVLMVRVGKKAADRILDGRTWDEFPNTGEEQR